MKIEIEKEFAERVPGYRALLFEADVENTETGAVQMEEMNRLAEDLKTRYEVSQINSIPAIAETRKGYKACGKDPNRYRPSQEQLMRRVVRGLGLYNVNAIVDTGNQFSLQTGCSIGCFDADKIEGDTLRLGIGKEGEPYEGIGRGELNIAGLPVFRDEKGGIGTPTSDNERTKIDMTTRHLVATVHLFDTTIDKDEIVGIFTDLFTRFAGATHIRSRLVTTS